MMWQHTLKLLQKSKVVWLFLLLIITTPIGLYVYNANHEDLTIHTINNELNEWQRAINFQRDYVGMVRLYNREFDLDNSYDTLLQQSVDTIREWQHQLANNQGYVADIELQLYDNMERESQFNQPFGHTILPNELAFRKMKAEYMREYQLPYTQEHYPTHTALWVLQLTQWVFNIGSALLIVLLFGYTRYEDVRTSSNLLWSLPIHRQKLARYPAYTVLLISGSVVLFIGVVSIGVLSLANQWQTWHYPYTIVMHDVTTVIPIWHVILAKIIVWISSILVLHVVVQLLMLSCKMVETNILAVVSLLMIGYGTYRYQWWHPFTYLLDMNDILRHSNYGMLILIYSVISIVVWLLFHYSPMAVYVWERLRQLHTGSHTRSRWVAFLEQKVRVSFEFTQRFHLEVVKKTLVGICLVVVVTYGGIHYYKAHIQEYMLQEAQREYQLNERSLVAMRQYQVIALEQLKISLAQDFSLRQDKSQPFELWLADNHSEQHQMIMSGVLEYESSIYDTEYKIEHLRKGTFQGDILSHYRRKIYEKAFQESELYGTYIPKRVLAGYYQNEYIKEHGLSPIVAEHLIYDQYVAYPSMSELRISDVQWEDTTLHSALLMMEYHVYLVLIVALTFALSATMSEERGANHHLMLRFSLPIRRSRIYWQKVHFNMLSLLGALTVGILLYIGMTSVVSSFGQSSYPIVVFDAESIGKLPTYTGYYATQEKVYFHLEPIIRVVGRVVLLSVGVVLWLSSLMLMMSTVIKRRLVLVVAVVVLSIGGYMLSVKLLSVPSVICLPFVHLNIYSLSDGWLSTLRNAPIPLTLSMSVLLAWTGLNYIVGRVMFYIKWERK